MKLVFLGTRGYIESRNRFHKRHSSLLISYKGHRIMVDCGEDWLQSDGSRRMPSSLRTRIPITAGVCAMGLTVRSTRPQRRGTA